MVKTDEWEVDGWLVDDSLEAPGLPLEDQVQEEVAAQREFKGVNLSQWTKKLKNIDHLRFKNAFYNSFASESKFIESENKNSLWQIVWLLEVGEGM